MNPKARSGYIVAIDGPSGAGKSTISHLLAEALDGILLDTGAMYRALALIALEDGATTALRWAALAKKICYDIDSKSQAVLANGIDFGARLRGEHVGAMASKVSASAGVRAILTARQRVLAEQLVKRRPVVVEGRDIGTVVFPKAPFKFYVTAQAKVRAERRYQQLTARGIRGLSKTTILREINNRDQQDMNRKIAPLRCADDAVIVDTSKMPVAQVVQFLKTHIEAKISTSLMKF